MADETATERKVRGILVEQLGIDEAEATPGAKFNEDLGCDSLDQIEIVMAFEEEFGLEISDEDAMQITTVQQAIDYVDEAIAKRAKR